MDSNNLPADITENKYVVAQDILGINKNISVSNQHKLDVIAKAYNKINTEITKQESLLGEVNSELGRLGENLQNLDLDGGYNSDDESKKKK